MTPYRSSQSRRIDSSSNCALSTLARLGADAFGYRASLEIDRALAQLLRVRVAQVNNCIYCLELHHRVARDIGVPQVVLDTLTAWWETEFHDPATQAALAYAEAITRISDTTADHGLQAHHDALARHFSPAAILEILGVVINMNVWTRLKLAEGAQPAPDVPVVFDSVTTRGWIWVAKGWIARVRSLHSPPRVGSDGHLHHQKDHSTPAPSR